MKSIIILTVISLFSSCGINKLDIQDMYKHKPTHILQNDILLEPIQKYLEEELKDDFGLDVLLLEINEGENKAKIYFKISNLEMQKKYFDLKNEDSPLKGFSFVENILVLLYGDGINTFFKKVNKTPKITDSIDNKLIINVHKSYQYYLYNKKEGEIEFRGIIDKLDSVTN